LAQQLAALDLAQGEAIGTRLPNSLEHARLAFGAHYAGIPFAPLAPTGEVPDGIVLIDGQKLPPRGGNSAMRTDAGPQTIAKILFTSGSTESPKGVMTTHRMLCANQSMLRQALAPYLTRPPVVCDWLPWRHVYGGNHNFGFVLSNGGTLYIDDGAPTPALADRMLANLQETRPSVLFVVPRSFGYVLPRLPGELEVIFNGGAALTPDLYAATARLPFFGGYGATETAPFTLFTGPKPTEADFLGLPAAGVEVRLEELGEGLFEASFRGPHVTPGYWRDAAGTGAAISSDGFWRSGDVVRWHTAGEPGRGLRFVSRLGGDFKLSSATAVRVASLTAKLGEALAPDAEEIVLLGENRPALAAAILLAPHADKVRLQVRLRAIAAGEPSSSRRVEQAWFLAPGEWAESTKGRLRRKELEILLAHRPADFTLE
jgi:feruloyl-CoA synthase